MSQRRRDDERAMRELRELIAREIWRYNECPWDYDNPPEGMGLLQKQLALDQAESLKNVILTSPLFRARVEIRGGEMTSQNALDHVIQRLILQRDALETQRDALLKALSPFADFACRIDENETSQGYSDACPLCLKPDAFPEKEIVNLGHCRQARAAIKFAEGK
jgi:hypothetical protein